MSKTDTSRAALDRLRERLTWHAGLHRDMGRPCSADCLNEARQMIDALAAEREEAIDQRNAADFVLALSIEQSTRHSVERDAARAEAARLQEAIRWAVGERADFVPPDNPRGPYWWRNELMRRAGMQYEIAAKEPGHD